ncbi:putative PB1 domain-containing protein [Helianthus annuus]|nr:putative PB1 domain-containing protein [Helianthus annuus]
MEQTIAPPPPSAVTTTVTNSDSVTSSPRYRNTDSWIEDNTSTAATTAAAAATGGLTKLRLMCSYGGHIVPRPHDKSLCYVGGDTRIVVVDRHTTLSDLTNRLTKTLLRSATSPTTTSFTVKYQLPSEDLDSLISVTTDEDLENMIDEYDRLNSPTDSNKSNRLRLFLFPVKPESVTSIGSLLESSTKSEDWFLNALNGTSSGFSDTSSVNCLLGLEDDISVTEKKDSNINNIIINKGVIGKNMRANNSVQDVQSVPDSPMMETTSSFGSASSSPPVRVNMEDQVKVGGGIEEQFVQMSVQSVQQHVKSQEDVSFVAVSAPAGVPVVSKVAVMENSYRVASEDERSEQGVQLAYIKQQQQFQQKFDLTSPDSVSSDGSLTNPLSRRQPPVTYQDPVAQTQFSSNNVVRTTDPSNIHDQNTRIPIQQPQQVQDSGYVISTPTTQVDPQHPQLHPQPQFIHVPPPQYLHQPSGAVPMASYYQMYPSHSQIRAPHPAVDQHNFVYYMPARQPPQGYNVPLQADPAASAPPSNQVPPPSSLFTAPRAAQTAKTEPSAGVYRTATSSAALPPQLVQVPSSQHPIQPQYVGYSHIHQPPQPVTSGGSGNYVYEFADPSQQRPHIYYAAQPLPPQSAAQYQTMTSTLPVEAQAQAQGGSHLQADNSMKPQQVRTSSQP